MEWKSRFSKNDAAEFRTICNNRIEEIDPDGKSALALSGGTDSVTVLFAMLDTGRKPRCYTFYMDGIISVDLKSSRNLCKDFGLELVEIPVPSDLDTMYVDIQAVIPYCSMVKKTIIQCMIPWKYIYPAMSEDTIITGIGGDDLFCTQRKLQVAYHKGGDEALVPFRKCYSDDLTFSAANIARYGKVYGKRNVDFYNSEDIFGFINRFSLSAINKPMMKGAAVKAYMDYYKLGAYYRDQTEHSYQINSKLRDCHDRLLHSPYNKGGHKAIIGLYNEMAKGVKRLV